MLVSTISILNDRHGPVAIGEFRVKNGTLQVVPFNNAYNTMMQQIAQDKALAMGADDVEPVSASDDPALWVRSLWRTYRGTYLWATKAEERP